MENDTHPNACIMRELIKNQWEDHSIYAGVIDNVGNIFAKGQTTVVEDHDPTAHAEINAIRNACRKLNSEKMPQGFWLYSTFEPCPLCSAAIVWSGFEGVVYANNPNFRGKEVNWSFIRCREILTAGKYISEITLYEDFLIDEIKNYFT